MKPSKKTLAYMQEKLKRYEKEYVEIKTKMNELYSIKTFLESTIKEEQTS